MSQNVSSAVMQQRTEPHGIIQLSDAKALGLSWYFTGAACPRGHIAKRSVCNRDCRKCVDARRAANPEKKRAKERRYWANNVDKCREDVRKYRLRHIEKRREYDRHRYHDDPVRQAQAKRQAGEWWKNNKGKKNFMVARRRAWIKLATPPWLTAEQKRQIRAFYLEAAGRSGEWHVDHIYPLRAKNSCGLHVPWNLQILPGDDNRRKGNRI